MIGIVRPRSSIAVVGTGIAGLGAAWLLDPEHDVTLLEADSRLGGHSNTVTLPLSDGEAQVDTGFIVYNHRNYPLFSTLLEHLRVETHATDMSFGLSVDEGRFEFGSMGLNGLLAQRTNLLSPRFYRLLTEILRFNRCARRLAASDPGDTRTVAMTLGAFLVRQRFSPILRDRYLLPMAAAIWSCPLQQMLDFPAFSLARFFDNHGLLDLRGRPRWRSVIGGSRRYVQRLAAGLSRPPLLDARVRSVTHLRSRPCTRVGGGDGTRAGWRLTLADGRNLEFDAVVLAVHADQAARMLEVGPQRDLLSRISYQPNRVVLHQDPRLMPRRRAAWSSWNYLSQDDGLVDGRVDVVRRAPTVTYWMNNLQRLDTRQNLFVSLNPSVEPRHVLYQTHYEHPVFDESAHAAQRALQPLQGERGLWLCGSYHGHGFHEDAFRSACAVAAGFGVQPRLELPEQSIPWLSARDDLSTGPTRVAA
ncbi:MAG: FAD-dependent oxidoreductase [Gammaproteobacteria bacterium]|nr:FAD-dependent oxidoreductase [Gammaproteobacteria bacterium]